jgi:hypothetical protein
MSQPHIDIVGASNLPLPHLMDEMLRMVKSTLTGNKTSRVVEVKGNV